MMIRSRSCMPENTNNIIFIILDTQMLDKRKMYAYYALTTISSFG